MHKMMTQQVKDEERAVQRWLTEARCTGTKDTYAAKRRYPRFTWDARLEIEVLDEGDRKPMFFATTRDISVGGVGLKIRRRIDSNALVRMTHEETGEVVHGRVRFCHEALGSYIVGVEFIQPSPPRAVASPNEAPCCVA